MLAQRLGIRKIEAMGIKSYSDHETEPGDIEVTSFPPDALQARGFGWLVVDDICASGATAHMILKHLPRCDLSTLVCHPQRAVYYNIKAALIGDPNEWVIFPWEKGRPAKPIEPEADLGQAEEPAPRAFRKGYFGSVDDD
jgi:hypoxanthine phosphoribosyltransferase